mgnify:CR=1 FL=1
MITFLRNKKIAEILYQEKHPDRMQEMLDLNHILYAIGEIR